MAAACREGAQAAVWMGVPGRHGGWSWTPLMGPDGRDPNVQSSSAPGGRRSGVNRGELNGLQRTQSPSVAISGDLLITGAAPSESGQGA